MITETDNQDMWPHFQLISRSSSCGDWYAMVTTKSEDHSRNLLCMHEFILGSCLLPHQRTESWRVYSLASQTFYPTATFYPITTLYPTATFYPTCVAVG